MFETFFHVCVACSQIWVQSLEFPFSGIYSGSTCQNNTRVAENYQDLTKPCHACDPNRNSLHCPGPLHRMAIFLECGNVANKKHKQCYVAVCAHTWNPKLASLPSRAFASEPKLIHTSVTIWCGRIQHKQRKNMKRQTSAQTAYDQFEMGQSTRNDCRVVASQTLIRMRVGWHDMMACPKTTSNDMNNKRQLSVNQEHCVHNRLHLGAGGWGTSFMWRRANSLHFHMDYCCTSAHHLHEMASNHLNPTTKMLENVSIETGTGKQNYENVKILHQQPLAPIALDP